MNKIKKNQPKVSELLLRIGAIKKENIEIFSTKTRDNNNLSVYRDKLSKVIFIDDFYIGDDEYLSGEYRQELNVSYEDEVDSKRRYNSYLQFIAGKSIVDFGCGAGSFLRLAKNVAKSAIGVEIQKDFNAELNKNQIICYDDVSKIPDEQDVIFLFVCLEHMENPNDILNILKSKLKKNNGKIIIEVPHAKDFLIDCLSTQSFIDFTLWSQHLILHTRESLGLLLADVGFNNVIIKGAQRFSISNHFSWVKFGKLGGHKTNLSLFETPELISAYDAALSKIDANDILVAVCSN